MTIYNDQHPNREAFIANLKSLGYVVHQPESPLHTNGVKSGCMIVSWETDAQDFNDTLSFQLKLDFNKYDFYAKDDNVSVPFAVTKPHMTSYRPYGDAIYFLESGIKIMRAEPIYYQNTNY